MKQKKGSVGELGIVPVTAGGSATCSVAPTWREDLCMNRKLIYCLSPSYVRVSAGTRWTFNGGMAWHVYGQTLFTN